MAGWSSNSRYAFLGALRSSAQVISYEISLGLVLINIVLCVGSLNLSKIIFFQEHIWLIFPLFPLFIIFFISAIAESNRPPFDLPEAEGEIVAGYNVEYSSLFLLYSIFSEYGNIIFLCINNNSFFCGWHLPYGYNFYFSCLAFTIKSYNHYGFYLVRASFPRYRYDVNEVRLENFITINSWICCIKYRNFVYI